MAFLPYFFVPCLAQYALPAQVLLNESNLALNAFITFPI